VVDSIIAFCIENNSLKIMYNDTTKDYIKYVKENKKKYHNLKKKLERIYLQQ